MLITTPTIEQFQGFVGGQARHQNVIANTQLQGTIKSIRIGTPRKAPTLIIEFDWLAQTTETPFRWYIVDPKPLRVKLSDCAIHDMGDGRVGLLYRQAHDIVMLYPEGSSCILERKHVTSNE